MLLVPRTAQEQPTCCKTEITLPVENSTAFAGWGACVLDIKLTLCTIAQAVLARHWQAADGSGLLPQVYTSTEDLSFFGRSGRVSQIEWIAQAQRLERSVCGIHAEFHARRPRALHNIEPHTLHNRTSWFGSTLAGGGQVRSSSAVLHIYGRAAIKGAAPALQNFRTVSSRPKQTT